MWPGSDLLNIYRIRKLYRLLRKGWGNPALLKDAKYWQEVFKTAASIREVKEMLQGYKTYIIVGLTIAVTVLHALGYIDDELYKTLLALLGAGAAGTVAAKINRIQNEIKNKVNVFPR